MISLQLQKYNITISDSPECLFDFIKNGNYTGVAVLTDHNSARFCLPLVAAGLPSNAVFIDIPPGESHKTADTCGQVWEAMLNAGLDRRSLLICLGGGVIGDLGGFCAATYLRGIDFVQMPTTLLSMADSSIGGKVGVDFNFHKNIIGVFKDPAAVFIFPFLLKTLPQEEICSGFAEIFKHALIADAGLWESLHSLTDLGRADWRLYLPPSLAVKKRIVEEDPYEKGIRKALNFGHTFGHAMESFSLSMAGRVSAAGVSVAPLAHGHAVALGIICESWLSWRCLGLPLRDLEGIVAFVLRFYVPFPFAEADFSGLLALMRRDKKNREGRINFSLLRGIGEVVTDQFCEEGLIAESFAYYQEVCRRAG